MAGDKDEYDWIFDYTLQFLESEKFDASVMDFVDDNCEYFDAAEENKLIYTDIHNKFRKHIEYLIEINLGEVGITTELFYTSCERSRNNRNINKVVFERLTAIDDFQSFKNIMIRRNIELQIEAMQGCDYNDIDRGLRSDSSNVIRSMTSNSDGPSLSDYEEAALDEAKVNMHTSEQLTFTLNQLLTCAYTVNI